MTLDAQLARLAPLMTDVALVAAALLPLALAIMALEVQSRLRRHPGALYELALPPGPLDGTRLFRGLHGLLRHPIARVVSGQPPVVLRMCGRDHEVRLCIWIPDRDRNAVTATLRALAPGIELNAVRERPAAAAAFRASATVDLAAGPYLPIVTEFSSDPLVPLLTALADVGEDAELSLELLVRPKDDRWRMHAEVRAMRPAAGAVRGWPLLPPVRMARGRSTSETRATAAVERKASHAAFDCRLRIVAAAPTREDARQLVRAAGASLGAFDGAANALSVGRIGRAGPSDLGRRLRFPLYGGLLLTVPELAGLWHVPAADVPGLARTRVSIAAPREAQQSERILGVSRRGRGEVPVGLSIADSRTHLHLLGPSGTGKSTALLNLASQDIAAGRGCAVLDPKGDLVRDLLSRIPRARLRDVIYIGPDDPERSVGINPLEVAADEDPELVAENILTIFKRIYLQFWGMRTDDVLKSSLLTLLGTPLPTLAHVPALLTNATLRRSITAGITDPFGLEGFWRWYEGLTAAQRSEAIGPVLNKLRDFLVRPRLRHLLCPPRSTVDLRRVIDDGQILLADLGVGRWGETASALAGSFLVARLWQAALGRQAVREDARRDFLLYIDEFQTFLGIRGPFADALAQARGLRLSLTIANQHLGQLPRELQQAIRSNARSRLVFRCGDDDAAALAREFRPLDAEALLSLPRFEAAARLCLGGEAAPVFTLRTLPPAPPAVELATAAEVIAASRARYAAPVAETDRDLARRLRGNAEPGENPDASGLEDLGS